MLWNSEIEQPCHAEARDAVCLLLQPYHANNQKISAKLNLNKQPKLETPTPDQVFVTRNVRNIS